jgi:hypothetical protein
MVDFRYFTNSSVGIVTGQRAGRPENQRSIRGRGGDFSLLHASRTPLVSLESHPLGTGGAFLRGKAVEA